ncbi:MAG: hypothetical protein KKH08_03960 [Candidatus Omnitrophica bacterium]|nr:hypothetical protein [Candidatus Omnitrophota bacterium]
MRKLTLVVFCLFICGCVATSKTVEKKSLPGKTVIPEKVETVAPAAEAPAPMVPEVTRETVMPETPPAIEEVHKKVLTYSQITNLLSKFIDIQPVNDASGQPRYIGTSESGFVTLGIIGDKQNITTSSLKLYYPIDIPAPEVDLNNAMMIRFLKNVAPEIEDWPVRASAMANRLYAIQSARIQEGVVLRDVMIQVIYDKDEYSISIIVTPNNS